MDAPSTFGQIASKRCAFLFAHYDDSVLNAAYLIQHAAPGSIDLVLCTGLPDGWRWWRKNSLVARARETSAFTVLCHLTGRPAYGEWDRYCGMIGTAEEVNRQRDAEHRAACADFRIPTYCLGELDGQYGRSKSRRFDDAAILATEIIARADIEAVVTHSPCATHPDHQKAERLARVVSETLRLQLVEVCDRPYTRCTPEECANADINAVMSSTCVELDDASWRRKADALGRYESQMRALELAEGAAIQVAGLGEHHRNDFAISARVVLDAIAAWIESIQLGLAVTVFSMLIWGLADL